MKKYLPANDWHTFHELRSGRQNSFGQNTFGNWRGSTNSIRPAVVCQSCNNGWMSKIETQAKESLIALMSGQSFILTTERQYKIARWAALKAMVYEYNVDGPLSHLTIFWSMSDRTRYLPFLLLHCRVVFSKSGLRKPTSVGPPPVSLTPRKLRSSVRAFSDGWVCGLRLHMGFLPTEPGQLSAGNDNCSASGAHYGITLIAALPRARLGDRRR
jgi:hypothetical protein